jgi:AraC family transcriptional regulator
MTHSRSNFHRNRVKVNATGERGAHAKLSHGEFFGRFQREIDAGGFSLANIRADPQTDVQRHTHDAAHFIFVTRGIYVTGAAGAPSECSSPILIYNPPGTTHRDRFRRSADGGFHGRFLSISITTERMKSIAEGVVLPERSISVDTTYAKSLAARLIGELGQWEPASPLAAEGICLELTACVARRDVCDEKTPPRWLSIAREMLHDCAEQMSVSEIAAACGVHPVHLARTFRRFFGCSPGAYLRHSRVERAAALLRRGRLSLTEIALRSGFADQSHMTHGFQSALAITPGAYRRHVGSQKSGSDNDVANAQDGPTGTL